MSTMTDKTLKLVEELSQLSVLELAELKVALEEKWGVKAAAAAVAVAAAAVAAAAAPAAEATDFKVLLVSKGANAISVIKEIRAITNLGLKEAKDLVDGADSGPKEVKASAPKAEAEEIKKKLEAAGAKVDLKPNA